MLEHPIHPMVVHFPIALLFTAVFFEILGFLLRRDSCRQFGLWLLILGFVGGIAAYASGVWSEDAVKAMGVPEEAIDRHESFAMAAMVAFGLVLAVRRWVRDRWSARNRMIYMALAVAGLLLLGTTGFFGGDLVYRYGADVQKPSTGPPAPREAAPPSADRREKN